MKSFSVFTLLLFSILLLSSCEQEWKIDITDCREKINIWENNISNFFKTFTCNNYKSKDWYLISWTCSYVELSWDKCIKSYSYEKKTDYNCWENAHLEYRWCFCDSWYVNINEKCINLKCEWDWIYKKNDWYCECKDWYNKTNLDNWEIKCSITLEKQAKKLLPVWSYIRWLEEYPWKNNTYIWLYIEKGYTFHKPNIYDEEKPLEYSFNKTDWYWIIWKYHIFIFENWKIIEDIIIPDIYWWKDYLFDWSWKNINLFSYKNTMINNNCYYWGKKVNKKDYYKIESNNLLNFVDIDSSWNKYMIRLIWTQVWTWSSPISTKDIYIESWRIKVWISDIKDWTINVCYY